MLNLMVNLRNRALIELSEVKLKIPAEFLGKGGAVPSTPVITGVLESTRLLSSQSCWRNTTAGRAKFLLLVIRFNRHLLNT